MGTTVHLAGIPAEVLAPLRRSPSVLDLLFHCNGDLEALRERAREARSGTIDRLDLAGADPVELERFAFAGALEGLERCMRGEVDLEKAYGGIHFLLTGEPEPGRGRGATPLDWALGGSEPDLEGTPYEVAPHVVGEAAVAEVANALARIDSDQLRRRFDRAALEKARVPPEGLWRHDDALEYLLERHDDLVWFYKRAAALGRAVLVCTSL
jgi:hypothetical protein